MQGVARLLFLGTFLMLQACAGLPAGTGSSAQTADAKALIGKSEADMFICAGPASKDFLADKTQKWTYDRGACRVEFMFQNGYVSDVHLTGAASSCTVINRCLASR